MSDKVHVDDNYKIFSKYFFQIREGRLRYKQYDGDMSPTLHRLYFERGDSVAALMHHPGNDTIILTEQFRYPAYVREEDQAWMLEIPAGSVERDESPRATMSREIIEETGYESDLLHHIQTFFVSPGGTSERVHLYYARLDTDNPRYEGGGLDDENEDIKVLHLTVDEALEKLQTGDIVDAKTVIALQWLQLHRDTLTTLEDTDEDDD
jgi:ADP-ribose pyrophosphatase